MTSNISLSIVLIIPKSTGLSYVVVFFSILNLCNGHFVPQFIC